MENREEIISQIREFNRFYTVLLGFLNRNYLDSGYSVTETRILFELKQNDQISASRLIDMLHLDKSYVSRLLRNFEQKEMITRHASLEDGRTLLIQLTPKGLAEAKRLIDITNHRIYELIEPLDMNACENLCSAMKMIAESFRDNQILQEEK